MLHTGPLVTDIDWLISCLITWQLASGMEARGKSAVLFIIFTGLVSLWRQQTQEALFNKSYWISQSEFIECFFVQFHLVESELSIISIYPLKRFVPGAFKVHGIDQHQPAVIVQYIFGQHVSDFTWNHMEAVRSNVTETTATFPSNRL